MPFDTHDPLGFSLVPTSQPFDTDSGLHYLHDSPSAAADRRTCADPRMLQRLWPQQQQPHQPQHQQHQSQHQQQQQQQQPDDFDHVSHDASRPMSSSMQAYSVNFLAHYGDTSAYDQTQMTPSTSWGTDGSLAMGTGHMFGGVAHDAAGDALTPPDSDGDGVSSSDPGDWRSVKEEDQQQQQPQQLQQAQHPHRQHPYSRPQKTRLGPGVRSNSPHMRPDGYKKKNAKFDIPADRDLMNIDALMEKAKARGDESELKLLKTQKRLLRNREAAQKKKDYTAALEVRTAELEEELKLIKAERDQLAQQVPYLSTQMQQAKVHTLHVDNERNLLQSKVDMLEQSLCGSSASLPVTSVTADYTDVNSWSPALVDDFDDLVAAGAKAPPPTSEAALMLLLSGATSALPSSQRFDPQQLPEHVRLAAPVILNAIFQCAGDTAVRFAQPAHGPTSVDDRTALVLDKLVQRDAVHKFRTVLAQAGKNSS